MSKKDIYFDEPSRLSTAVTSARHKLSLLERRGTMPRGDGLKITSL